MKRIDRLDVSAQLDDATRTVAGQDEGEFLDARRNKYIIRKLVDTVNDLEERSYASQKKVWELEKKVNDVIDQLNTLAEETP